MCLTLFSGQVKPVFKGKVRPILAFATHHFANVRSVDIFQIHGTILEFHGWNGNRRQR